MTQSTSGSFWGRVTEKTEYFWNTNLYFALMLAVTAVSMLTQNVVPSTVALAVLCAWMLVFCRDILAAALPFLLIFLLSTLQYNDLSVFLPCAPLAALVIGGLIVLWIAIGIKNLGWVNKIAMAALFILSIVLVTTILLIACPSYFEPVLFLLTIGVAVLLTVFCIVKAIFAPVLLNNAASMAGIAVAHSVFNILCTAILLPCGGLLEKLAIRLVPDKAHAADKTVELDQRLLTTPAVALERCRVVTCEMAEVAVRALQNALRSFDHYTEALASAIREDESRCDHYEDVLGTYLVKLSAQKLGEQESEESAELLKAIGDFERISDHAVNVLESAEELREKGLAFSDEAKRELSVLSAAVNDILMRALDAFRQQDMTAARQVEPLEQVIDDLKEQLRTRHILRMQQGQCSIEAGFVWSDLLTDLERTSDHCSNIAGCVIDAAHHDLNMHATLDAARRRDPDFREQYQRCAAKYQV